MKYDALSRNTVKITLSEEDMREYSISGDSITLKTAEVKRSLTRLLKKMKLFTGYKPERLFLEAFPKNEGGCVLYVSNLGGDYDDCCDGAALTCTADSLDIMVKICSGLARIAENPEVSVYYTEGEYTAVVSCGSQYYEKVKHFLSEYGTVGHELSDLQEYGRLICKGNGCALFSKLI